MERFKEVLKKEDKAALPAVEGGAFEELKRKFITLVMLDDNHPYSKNYFPSRLNAEHEKRRQFFSNQRYMIHPLSKFSFYYDMYILILYLNLFIFKGLCFGYLDGVSTENIVPIITVLNILSYIDVIVIFRRGYTIKRTKGVELRRWHVAFHYLKSPYFICDVLSSLPKQQICSLLPNHCRDSLSYCILNTLTVLRLIRITTFIKLIKTISSHRRSISQNTVVMVTYFLVFFIFVHWMACMHYAVPRYLYYVTGSYSPRSWIVKLKLLHDTSLLKKYMFSSFKSFGYMLGINLKTLSMSDDFVEDFFVLLQYLIGKICLVVSWLILVHIFILSRSLNIKYLEVTDQVEFYMTRKQFPVDLRNRMLTYYRYKYQGRFFNEATIQRALSVRLKQEIRGYSSKKFIENSTLFKGMPPYLVDEIINQLTLYIYLPNDVVVQSGTEGDGLYFLSEGTVAVYSKSGNEVCHLQDGAYFGEISLVLQNHQRNATVVAIEICSILKMDKANFTKSFMSQPEVRTKLFQEAHRRATQTSEKEDQYKQYMFQKLYES